MITHECLKNTKFCWSYCSLFCVLFVCLFFYRYGKGMKRKSAVVDFDSFTLISVAVVHYNCVPSSSAPSLWKTNPLVLGRYQAKFQYWHLTSFQYRTPTTRWTSGKHYLIILKTSELFPRYKRYLNTANTNYVELLLESGFLFND